MTGVNGQGRHVVSLARARVLAAGLGGWAVGTGIDGDEVGPESAEAIGWAVDRAGELLSVLIDAERAAEFARLWKLPGRPFARTPGGRCLHRRDCRGHIFRPGEREDAHMFGSWPLTADEAREFLAESPERRCCKVCKPDPEAP